MNRRNSGSTRPRSRYTTCMKVIFSLVILSYIAIMAVLRVNSAKGLDSSVLSTLTTQQYSDLAQLNLDQHLNIPAQHRKEHIPLDCTFTVLLIHHCEYNIVTGDCNYIGHQRSQHLATLFGPDESTPWPIPSQLYALDQSCEPSRSWLPFPHCPGHNRARRDIQTLSPLLHSLQDMVNVSHSTSRSLPNLPFTHISPNILSFHNPVQLSGHIFDRILSNTCCGQLAVVAVANSFDIPQLAFELGCGPLNAGCPRSYTSTITNSSWYDSIWELSFVFTQSLDTRPVNSSTMKESAVPSPTWSVFGTIIRQNFDPLSFSTHILGLYNPQGS
jgi:hypothetical protein